MTTVLEKKVVISAEDLTGNAFAGIEKRIDLLSKASKRLSGGISGRWTSSAAACRISATTKI